ncbi:MAG: hypothetical protein ACRYFK_17220, partial [Janthinobacterium lividum]
MPTTSLPSTALPPSATHQRVLSSLVLLREDRLTSLRAVLGPHAPGIAQQWAADLSAADHAALAALHATYQLDTPLRSTRHEVGFRAAQLWEILGDASAARFGGYGRCPRPWRPTG